MVVMWGSGELTLNTLTASSSSFVSRSTSAWISACFRRRFSNDLLAAFLTRTCMLSRALQRSESLLHAEKNNAPLKRGNAPNQAPVELKIPNVTQLFAYRK